MLNAGRRAVFARLCESSGKVQLEIGGKKFQAQSERCLLAASETKILASQKFWIYRLSITAISTLAPG